LYLVALHHDLEGHRAVLARLVSEACRLQASSGSSIGKAMLLLLPAVMAAAQHGVKAAVHAACCVLLAPI
jgi:hypothetical protein